MSKQRRDMDCLGDILEAMARTVAYTDDLSYETFLNDTETQDAVIHNLHIIGEATK